MLGLGLNITKSPLMTSFEDPESISDLLSWWRYEYGYRNTSGTLRDITTTFPADDTNLRQWDDQVSGNHMVQITGSDQPRSVAADNSINFKNNAKYYSLLYPLTLTDYTIIVLCKFAGSPSVISNRTFFGGDGPPSDGVSDDLIRIVNPTQINFNYSGASIIINGLTTLAVDTYYVFTFTREDALTAVYVDGVLWGSVTEVLPVGIFYIRNVGANDPESQNYRGHWKDVTIFDRALKTFEILNMNTYLQAL